MNELKSHALEFALWLEKRRKSHVRFRLLFVTEELYNEFMKDKQRRKKEDEQLEISIL